MKAIPISAAKKIAEQYDYDQVIVIARKVGQGEHCTTYGVDKENCGVAARIGDFLKYKVMNWQPSAGQTEGKNNSGCVHGYVLAACPHGCAASEGPENG